MGQSKGVILFQSGSYSGGEGPALEFGSWERPTSRAGPPRSRYSLSYFPPRSTTSNRIGPMRARKSFRATARFACRIPSSVMGAGANRLMMSTTIGSGYAAVFATAAAKPSDAAPHRQRPGSRGGPLHPAPMVPPSGFFSAVVFCPAPDDAGRKRLVGQD